MNTSYGHEMIRLEGMLLRKWVHSDLIDMSVKEKINLVLHPLLVLTSRDHIIWINLIWFRIPIIIRMDWVWNSWGIELYLVIIN